MAESLEVQALRRLAAHIGARVTDTSTPGVHSASSYHYALGTGGIGLAIDLAEPSGPSHDTPGLLRINLEVASLIGRQCAELIYAGPGARTLRNGGPWIYSAAVLSAHHNHVHVAVNRGFTFVAPVKEVKPMWDPPLSVCATLKAPNGGVWGLAPDGGVFAFEGIAPFYGSAAGQAYFAGRRAARLEARADGGYDILATSGERYQYPAS